MSVCVQPPGFCRQAFTVFSPPGKMDIERFLAVLGGAVDVIQRGAGTMQGEAAAVVKEAAEVAKEEEDAKSTMESEL